MNAINQIRTQRPRDMIQIFQEVGANNLPMTRFLEWKAPFEEKDMRCGSRQIRFHS